MSNIIRATVFVMGGLAWFALALVCAFLMMQHLSAGVGIQFFISSGSVLIGLVHVVGFFAAASFCFVIGIGLCAHGLVPPARKKSESPSSLWRSFRSFIDRQPSPPPREAGLRCVRCEGALSSYVHFCPECGWTQPYDNVD